MQHKSATVLVAVRAAAAQVEGDDGAAARHKSYDSVIKKKERKKLTHTHTQFVKLWGRNRNFVCKKVHLARQ